MLRQDKHARKYSDQKGGCLPCPCLCLGSNVFSLKRDWQRHGLDATTLARQPDAGRLLMLRVAVAGVPVQRFADR